MVVDPPYIQKARVGRLDKVGLGLLAVGLGTLQIVLDKGQEDDWFGDRNFACGCFLIALFGGAIYGLITLLPLFYQTLLGYTAGLAGIAVAPRGFGAIFIMPIVGVLSGRIDDRWLIAAGFAIFGLTGIFFGHVTLGISGWSLLWPIIFSGVAAGLVLCP